MTVNPEISSSTDAHCPLCGTSIPPERTRDGGAECTVCHMTVLIKWRAPAYGDDGSPAPFPPPPHAWSAKLVVTEMRPEPQHSTPASHPYRSTPKRSVPGLKIAWVEDRFYMRLLLMCFLVAWIALPLGIGFVLGFTAKLLACCVPVLLLAWLTLMTWRGDETVWGDAAGLHWQRNTFFGGRSDVHVATGDLAQLFVRDTTNRSEGEGIPIPSFTVYARDRRGRDHEIASLESPEQAQWIEARLENYLGIVNRAVPGELPRRTQP